MPAQFAGGTPVNLPAAGLQDFAAQLLLEYPAAGQVPCLSCHTVAADYCVIIAALKAVVPCHSQRLHVQASQQLQSAGPIASSATLLHH